MANGSPTIVRIVMRGFNDAYGSWKISCMSRRLRRRSFLLNPRRSTPSNRTLPASGSMSRRIERPAVVFPQPDSPTRPRVSPRLISKLMSSTALTYAVTRDSTPRRIGKYFLRLRTFSKGSPASGMNATDLSYWLRRFLGLRAIALALRVGLAFAPLMSYWLRRFLGLRAIALALRVGLAFAPLMCFVLRF